MRATNEGRSWYTDPRGDEIRCHHRRSGCGARREVSESQHLSPWDTGSGYDDSMQTTRTEGAWGGGGRHIALASHICSPRVRVTGDQASIFGDTGEQWHIKFDARFEHYNVVVSAEHVATQTARPADNANHTCIQAGTWQTETGIGDTPSNGDNEGGSRHGKVERWGERGHRRKGAFGSAYAACRPHTM